MVVSVDFIISPFIDPYLYFYAIDTIYLCANCSCPNTYIKYTDGINCIKAIPVPNATLPNTSIPNATIDTSKIDLINSSGPCFASVNGICTAYCNIRCS